MYFFVLLSTFFVFSRTFPPSYPFFQRGTPLISVTSPFGLVATSVFRNTLGSCVISNLLPSDGDRAHLIIADMRTVPGAEGGGIFDNGGKCVGVREYDWLIRK